MISLKEISNDSDGMITYDYLVNHVPECLTDMDFITDNLLRVDATGQFLASSARYLSSIDKETFATWIGRLIEGAIEKDRERRYLWSLLEAVWGVDYMDHAEELQKTDNNFRRVYKRIYPGKKIKAATVEL